MEYLNEFAAWAWARHHNEWSWYIRPLFLLPFCYFAYRRSWAGIVGTLVALATSMFWFPAPQIVDAQVERFLAAEKEWLTGGWTTMKVVTLPVVPVFFWLLGSAFWQRSWLAGTLIINLMMVSKVIWSFAYGEDSAWPLLPPALLGVIICDVVIYLAYRWVHKPPQQIVTEGVV